MYFLAELKDGANVSHFKTALSRNGMKYREDKSFPKFLAIRSSRSRTELMDKFNKYAINISATTSQSLIEVIEMLHKARERAPAVIREIPVAPSSKLESAIIEKEPVNPTEIIYKEPDVPTLTSPPEPKTGKLNHIISLVLGLIGKGRK